MSSSHPAEFRKAAVLFAAFADEPHDVLFVERAAHLRRNAGQIGLPGGTVDATDGADPVVTALRELQEELGVSGDRVRVVGVLPELEQQTTGFLVTPIVGVVEPGTLLTIDPSETAGVFTVPLAAILQPGALYEEVELSRMRGITTYAFDYDEHHIWGLTGRILKSFVDAWNAPSSQLRSDIEAAFLHT